MHTHTPNTNRTQKCSRVLISEKKVRVARIVCSSLSHLINWWKCLSFSISLSPSLSIFSKSVSRVVVGVVLSTCVVINLNSIQIKCMFLGVFVDVYWMCL